MSKVIKKLQFILGLCLVIVGFTGFLGTAYISLSSDFTGEIHRELPLGEVGGIVVDSSGNVFLGSQSFSRVQVYNSEGVFMYAMAFHTGGSSFNLNMEDDVLYVGAPRSKILYLVENGELISEVENLSYDEFQEFPLQNQFVTEDDIRYEITKTGVTTIITVTQENMHENEIVIETSLFKWLFIGPFPAWLFLILGMFLLRIPWRVLEMSRIRM